MNQGNRFCIVQGHQKYQTYHICTFKQCQLSSRWCCSTCLQKQLHNHQMIDQSHILDQKGYKINQPKIFKNCKMKTSYFRNITNKLQGKYNRLSQSLINIFSNFNNKLCNSLVAICKRKNHCCSTLSNNLRKKTTQRFRMNKLIKILELELEEKNKFDDQGAIKQATTYERTDDQDGRNNEQIFQSNENKNFLLTHQDSLRKYKKTSSEDKSNLKIFNNKIHYFPLQNGWIRHLKTKVDLGFSKLWNRRLYTRHRKQNQINCNYEQSFSHTYEIYLIVMIIQFKSFTCTKFINLSNEPQKVFVIDIKSSILIKSENQIPFKLLKQISKELFLYNYLQGISMPVIFMQMNIFIIYFKLHKCNSISEKTQSLSIISNNDAQLVLKDILALEGQLDSSLFNSNLRFHFILSERQEFHKIEQIQNQRLLIEYSQNCCIYAGMMTHNQQLVVIKEMVFYQEEELMKILDEFKIQNKLNNLFPQQSLQLLTPVKVSKLRQFYGLKAAMERAETNLFIYSKKNKINANQAYTIFRIILKQLINMHSIRIAHRDVKPQNIFYAVDKGWLLSDFGESQEYEELESFYNIRGTLFFLMPTKQAQVNRGKQIQQNLLVNDLFALVVTIIIIQKIQSIDNIDITQEINNLDDQYLRQAIKTQSFQQLKQFEQELDDIQEETQYNQENYYKQFSSKEETYNNMLNYQSWINLCSYYIERQIYPEITTKIFQLINDNLEKIFQSTDYQTGNWLSNLQVNGKPLRQLNPNYIFKEIKKLTITQIELSISLLFNYGYSEKTIFYCYLERLTMYSEAEKQFKLFQQGLIFEPLNSEHQQQFLLKLEFYGQNNQQIDFGQKFEDLLMIKNINRVYVQAFEQDLYKYDQLDTQNTELIINLLEIWIRQLNTYSIFNLQLFAHLMQIISKDIQYESKSISFTRRTSILFDIGQIFILQENIIKFREIVKILQTQIFKAESWQQRFTFKIQILVLKYLSQNQRSKQIIICKLYFQIMKIKQVSYKVYKKIIQEYLISFLDELILKDDDYLCPKGIKLIIAIIDQIYQNKYYEKNYNSFQNYHMGSQNILIISFNRQRASKMTRDYQYCLSKETIFYFKHTLGKREGRFIKILDQTSKLQLQKQKQFMFEQFLSK
ncbi:hypothetical protein pb186bvf_019755 [Paramecium bursaria]